MCTISLILHPKSLWYCPGISSKWCLAVWHIPRKAFLDCPVAILYSIAMMQKVRWKKSWGNPCIFVRQFFCHKQATAASLQPQENMSIGRFDLKLSTRWMDRGMAEQQNTIKSNSWGRLAGQLYCHAVYSTHCKVFMNILVWLSFSPHHNNLWRTDEIKMRYWKTP